MERTYRQRNGFDGVFHPARAKADLARFVGRSQSRVSDRFTQRPKLSLTGCTRRRAAIQSSPLKKPRHFFTRQSIWRIKRPMVARTNHFPFHRLSIPVPTEIAEEPFGTPDGQEDALNVAPILGPSWAFGLDGVSVDGLGIESRDCRVLRHFADKMLASATLGETSGSGRAFNGVGQGESNLPLPVQVPSPATPSRHLPFEDRTFDVIFATPVWRHDTFVS